MDRRQAAAVLGLDESASRSEVDAAYRSQARLLHPDRWALFGDSERRAAAEAMERLNHARDVLSASDWVKEAAARRTPGPPLVTGQDLQRVWSTVGAHLVEFADNPYALIAWLVLATVSLLTGLLAMFWAFIALAVWTYLRQRAAVRTAQGGVE